MDEVVINSFGDYFNEVRYALQKLDTRELEEAYLTVRDCCYNNGTLYLFGNGGSAAIANHWVCDYTKGISEDTGFKATAISLCTNVPLITAIANDIGYEYIFSKQLEYLKPKNGDVAIAISSSGNSKNVIRGIQAAKNLGVRTITLTGFHGGIANSLGDVKVYLRHHNYGVVEDIHMMILHTISQRIRSHNAIDPKGIKL